MPYVKYDGELFTIEGTKDVLIADSQSWSGTETGDVFFITEDGMVNADIVSSSGGSTFIATTILIPIIISGNPTTPSSDDHQRLIDIYLGEEEQDGKRTTLVERLMSDPNLEPPTIEKGGFHIGHSMWYYLLRNATRREPTMLIGETGGGKTELAELVALAMNMPFSTFNMAISNPYSTLCGKVHAENATTSFVRARFSLTVEQENQFILLDELSRAVPTAANILLPILDKQRTLYIEDAGLQVKVPDSVVFFATANIGAKYSGTYSIDGAIFDRFAKINVPYLESEIMVKILVARCGISDRTAQRVVSIVDRIRAEALSHGLSTREALRVGELIYDGYNIAEAFEYAVIGKFDPGDGGSGEQEMVRSIIQTAG